MGAVCENLSGGERSAHVSRPQSPDRGDVLPRTTVRTIVRVADSSIVFGTSRFVVVSHRGPQCLYTDMTTTSATPTDHDRETRPLLISIAQAAAILAVSRSSIYQLIWNEQLTPIRIGRSVRFTIEQIEDFVARRVAESHQ
jgi:excisionase family DNA binding protein